MKFFLNKFFLFTCLFFLFFILLITFLDYCTASKLRHYRVDPGTNTLVIGDSHTQTAINDKVLGKTENFSQNSEGYVYSYYKLLGILKNNPQVKTILLGFSYHNLSSYFDSYFFEPGVAARYFYIVPGNCKFIILKNNAKSVGDFLSYLLRLGVANVLHSGQLSFLGNYVNNFEGFTADSQKIGKRIQAQYYQNGNLNSLSYFNIFYLNKIIQLCKDANIQLIFLNTPLHKFYKSKVPVKFQDAYKQIIKDTRIPVINFDQLNLPDSCFLPDGDHIAKSGAVIVSQFLKEVVRTYTFNAN